MHRLAGYCVTLAGSAPITAMQQDAQIVSCLHCCDEHNESSAGDCTHVCTRPEICYVTGIRAGGQCGGKCRKAASCQSAATLRVQHLHL